MASSGSKKKKTKETIFTVVPVDKNLINTLYGGLKRSVVLKRLAELNIPFPAQLADVDEAHQFPIDVTRESATGLRQKMSYWTSQMARVNALLGLARAERKRLDRKLDRASKMRFSELAQRTSNKKPLVDDLKGRVLRDKNVAMLERKLDEAEQMEIALEPLFKDFVAYVKTLESELMFRMAEMKSFRE